MQLALILIFAVMAAVVFAQIDGWTAMGRRPSGERLARIQRSPNYRGGRFKNPQPLYNDYWGMLTNMFSSSAYATPNEALPVVRPERSKHSHEDMHKLNPQNVYFAESRQEAETLLKQWHKKTSKSTIGLIQKMSKTVMAHWDGILSYFDSALTTGFLEGINSLIQSAKARARGYRNPRNMISMAYLIAGKLRFNKLNAQPT